MSKLAISIEGFIANELAIREVTGHRVLDVSVPHTPRKQENGEWVDAGPTEWFRATFWDEHADAVLFNTGKGDLVTLTGGLKSGSYTKNDGGTGISLEVTFPTIAVVVRRPKRGEAPATRNATVEEPWAASAPASTETWNTPGSYSDETPF